MLDQELQASGGAAYELDVSHYAQVSELAEKIAKEYGSIDVWINNAGVNRAIGPTWEVDADEWVRDVSTNLIGTFHGVRAAVPIMLKQGSGCIINLAGGGADRGTKYGNAYSTAKTGVVRLTETLALELAETGKNIRVFAMNPGLNESDMTKYLRETEIGKKYYPSIDELFKKGQYASPEKAPELAKNMVEGLLDAYQGRLISVGADIKLLQEKAPSLQDDQYKLRLVKGN